MSVYVQDTLLVHEVLTGIPQKPKERRLFLFEQIIIVSEMIERKKGDFSNASYIYKNSVKVTGWGFPSISYDPTHCKLMLNPFQAKDTVTRFVRVWSNQKLSLCEINKKKN